ncbi:MAG: ribonuclease HII [Pyrinomonadaceae bacterium]
MRDAEINNSVRKKQLLTRVSLFSDFDLTSCGIVFEEQARSEGFRFIAGVDEVGRGCLAGPVVAAACILDPLKSLPDGLNDSKKVTPEKRRHIAEELKQNAVAYAIGRIEAEEIDEINILEATKKAMVMAIGSLQPSADFLLIDALQLKQIRLPQKGIIRGDSISASIAAASIIAKTFRDDLMRELDIEHPQYGFAQHVGYGTAVHWEALRIHGPCRLHRRSFKGVLQPLFSTEKVAGDLF